MKAVTIKNNKWVRRVAYALGALVLLWVILWLAVPPIAKSQAQKHASAALGREVTIGKIDFKPWTLELAVNDLRIASADGSHAQIEVGRIYVDAEMQSILRLAPVVDAVKIERPTIRAVRNKDGSYDFDDVLKRIAASPQPEKKDASEPARFAIYNIELTGGSVDFDDQALGPKHEIRDLTLGVPFLSSLPSQREVKVMPKLAFTLNGSHFDSSAEALPFAETRQTGARMHFQGLDLQPFLAYAPRDQVAKLAGGSLDADLQVEFQQGPSEGLRISGTVEVRDAKLLDARDKDLASLKGLKVVLADVRPLEGKVHLSEVALTGPQLLVSREADGRLNLQPTQPGAHAGEPPEVSRPVAEAAKGAAEKLAWTAQIDAVTLDDGAVQWRDASVSPAAEASLTGLQLKVQDVRWPMEQPARFEGAVGLGGGSLKFQGEATDQMAKVQTEVGQLPLKLAAPYVSQFLDPALDGTLAGRVGLQWSKPDRLLVDVQQFTADGLALRRDKAALASVSKLTVTGAKVNLTERNVTVQGVELAKPVAEVERDGGGRWMYEDWLKTSTSTSAGQGADRPAGKRNANDAKSAEKPWALSLDSLKLSDGQVGFSDKSVKGEEVDVKLTSLDVSAQKFSLDGKGAMPIDVSGRIASGARSNPGRFSYKGTLALTPLTTQGQLDVGSIPVHAFKAYVADQFPNLDLRRAYFNYKGALRFASESAGPRVSLQGDTSVDNMRVNSSVLVEAAGGGSSLGRNASRLLSWQSLQLRGVKFDMVPKTPFKLDVRETALTDLFARIVIDEAGTLHLQDLASSKPVEVAGPPKPGDKAAAPVAPPAAGAGAATTVRKPISGETVTRSDQPVTPGSAAPAQATTRRPAAAGGAVPAEQMVGGDAAPPTAQAAPATPAEPAGPQPVINFGPISLVNGRIDFTDHFIKPNYSADLSALTGKLSAFSSQPVDGAVQMADLELRGKAQQTASLEIAGKLNPLVKPLQLDIGAKVRDLELAPLSPYTVRYTGHGIERGKMSVDVDYKVEPDGRLTATNKLVLNQLTFGEEVPGATSTLPVKLAVALLADRNGVIDVDLPLSGSVNDPQFSIAPLIWKGIVNLIVKAITSPISLLTGGGGGGSGGPSDAIAFGAGLDTLDAAAKQSLDKIAKAMTDRAGLQMTVVGTASLEKEKEAYQRARLRQMAQAEKRRSAVRAGKDASSVEPVTDAEYPALLEAVYKRADISKPRNLIGIAKDLPQEEMEKLLMADMKVDDESIRKLAVERGVVVRDYLLEHKVPAESLFLGAVQTKPSGADWKPSALLKVEVR
ncbi:DUF748 domain-containing protein [Variovorax dokdonensis]|uniref:DUF748 domain-containing protein n=1 Tax=Variovorax dokdonensis TaxID=344883 RepID=A0ABT7ND24_9BURK|nr:DUF748 domain-containing protein [Variovorax dokdonensis]MDM0045817.1 DUF748 domain-containing protein [Variovorax dokdonensis]